ncbi:hypothetical protein FISHEDRAFT_74387 [Fistulina hepatica ATCC 64428]|uniref:RING-type domain-containing protein n=1 Tax=Fistulina hepatica ATCC 64428 TaxID=1128425 RepID=A0A0D7ACQ8_9AGAR|nr:hypothetical protein FISHEDRAFT_74387 [Fistulina hepatica ATCC 64428]
MGQTNSRSNVRPSVGAQAPDERHHSPSDSRDRDANLRRKSWIGRRRSVAEKLPRPGQLRAGCSRQSTPVISERGDREFSDGEVPVASTPVFGAQPADPTHMLCQPTSSRSTNVPSDGSALSSSVTSPESATSPAVAASAFIADPSPSLHPVDCIQDTSAERPFADRHLQSMGPASQPVAGTARDSLPHSDCLDKNETVSAVDAPMEPMETHPTTCDTERPAARDTSDMSMPTPLNTANIDRAAGDIPGFASDDPEQPVSPPSLELEQDEYLSIVDEEDTREIAPAPLLEGNSETPSSSTPSQEPASPVMPSPRFASPGTLVVVQGVVHTTDTPRSTHQPSVSHEAANLPEAFSTNGSTSFNRDSQSSTPPTSFLSDQSATLQPSISASSESIRRNATGSRLHRLSAMFTRATQARGSTLTAQDAVVNNIDDEERLSDDADGRGLESLSSGSNLNTPNTTAAVANARSFGQFITPQNSGADASSSSPSGADNTPSTSTDVRSPDVPTQEHHEVPLVSGHVSRLQTTEHGVDPSSSRRYPENDSTISNNSVEVLGTLLSVAAAATAASLLTGSTAHFLHRSDATPTAGSSTPPPDFHEAMSTQSPQYPVEHIGPNSESTAGQSTEASLPLAYSSPSMRSTPSLQPTRSGVRQAVDGVRQRLRLGRSTSSGVHNMRHLHSVPDLRHPLRLGRSLSTPAGLDNAYSSFDAGVSRGSVARQGARPLADNTPTMARDREARDTIITEMTRVFRLGMGLSATDEDNDTRRSQQPSPIPEAVISMPAVPPSDHATAPSPVNAAATMENIADVPREASDPQPNAIPSSEPHEASIGSFERFLVDLQQDLRVALLGGEVPGSFSQSGSLEGSSADRENSSDDSSSDTISITEPTEEESSSFEGSRPPRAVNRDTESGGRINWWRLYRFPPIVFPLPPAALGIPRPTNAASEPDQTTDFAPSAESPAEVLENDADADEQPASAAPSTVVPVIVVGVQSVSLATAQQMNWVLPPAPPPPHIDEPYAPSSGTVTPISPTPSSSRRPSRWSTAANAIRRNVRNVASRRSVQDSESSTFLAEEATPTPPSDASSRVPSADDIPAEPTGETATPGAARTFLVYVIGGYYPPDHSIVTGGENNSESFEQLIALADLLGQVKPPTVTRDEIERSGLQIIRASQLNELVQTGRLKSSCAERCLVCLDEYEPDDELRIMNCQHGFHKRCVDRWLETGKNNCPACRTTAVATEPAST